MNENSFTGKTLTPFWYIFGNFFFYLKSEKFFSRRIKARIFILLEMVVENTFEKEQIS